MLRMTRSSRLRALRQFSPNCAAIRGQCLPVNQIVPHQLPDNRRHATGAVEVLAQVLTGGHQINQQWDIEAERLPIVDRLHAHMSGERNQVNGRVRRAADSRN